MNQLQKGVNMNVTATQFKQNFGYYSSLILEGKEEEVQVTNRGRIIGVYSRPKRSEKLPFFGITTEDLLFDRDELNERG